MWQWGRLGAMPRIAKLLAEALGSIDGVESVLSLSNQAELLKSVDPGCCDLRIDTYSDLRSFALRAARVPFAVTGLAQKLRAHRLDMAVCVHPGPLDALMVSALRRLGVPFIAVLHDPDLHPGDGWPLQAWLQRWVFRRATALGVLTEYTAARAIALGFCEPSRPLLRLNLPPMLFSLPPSENQRRHDGVFRVLMFGRLLEYKGLDLLADTLDGVKSDAGFAFRVVGRGPETPSLRHLRKIDAVEVENRWVPENEIGLLLGWADALILPYREASQSGVLAAALAAGRFVLATRVGGLPEQLGDYSRGLLCEPDAADLLKSLQRLRSMADDPPKQSIDAAALWHDMAVSLVR